MRPVFTLTGNLLAERTFELANRWEEGGTHRAVGEQFQIGGKGFNVAKMLHRLGAPVTALGFVGGAAGEECRTWLAEHAQYASCLFTSTTPTRTGLVVRAPGCSETTFLGPDRPLDAEELRQCAEFLNTLPAEAGVALCGSFPGWEHATAVELRAALVRRAREGFLMVDSYGPPLRELVQWPLRLVKINRQEFEGLWRNPEEAESMEARLRRALERWPVAAWVITDGARPVWHASREGIEELTPPKIEPVSATGSGDVLFAAILDTWYCRSGSLADAVRMALPLAAANATSAGIADFPLPVVRQNANQR